MEDDNLPIALRRAPRNSVGVENVGDAAPAVTVAKTPRKNKKRVRFSDPGPSTITDATGLTPMIRRTSIITPKRRRVSTPARSSGNGATTPSRLSSLPQGEVTFSPLHQTVDGRVQRRVRRSGVRDMLNKIDQDKRRKVQASQAEIKNLHAEVKARDREIHELQNATIVLDTERIWDLEQQVANLKKDLARRAAEGGDQDEHQSRSYDWTLAARDPFADDYMDMTPDEEDEDEFGNTTVAQLACSTPSRGRSSFPTPPATSPTMPATPCSRPTLETPKSHIGVQVNFSDSEKRTMEDELASLQLEVTKLATTLDSYKSLTGRMTERLSTLAPITVDEISNPTDTLERQVELLLQAMSDRTAALTHLTSSISDLGFPGDDASEIVTSLASGFRAARLELEYLTPGEISLPLTSHGAEVLDLLLTRLRDLAKKSREDETSIDEYHEIESSLRKQLDARVSVMDGLKTEMSKAERLLNEKDLKVQELQVGNDRLKGAVNGYIRDISELEKLVERMEQEGRDAESTLCAQQETNEQVIASKEGNISELETKLAETVGRTQVLQKEMSDLQDSQTKHVVSLNKRHGTALALRDARVMELRGEIDRVNESLRSAHETIRQLRVENSGLSTKMDEEKTKAKAVIDSMKDELQRALQMSQEFLNSPKRARRDSDAGSDKANDGIPSSPLRVGTVVQAGGYLAGDLARRASKKMRRRYDSGLGFLDDEEVDI